MNRWSKKLQRLAAALVCVCIVFSNVSFAASDGLSIVSPSVKLANDKPRNITTVDLKQYAKLTPSLWADSEGTPLPEALPDGQPLYFQLVFDLFKEENIYKLRKDYKTGLVDENTVFTSSIDFLSLLQDTNYPTSFDSQDNIASDNGTNIFRWWVDQDAQQICLCFFENVYTSDGDITNAKIAFSGELDAAGKDDEGQLKFGVDNNVTTLMAKQGYTLLKKAGAPYYSGEAGSYLTQYTVTMTLDQRMKLSDRCEELLYGAALSLEDTVVSGGALTGEIYGTPAIAGPEGETVSIALNHSGTTNTMPITSSDDILEKGTYTITYTMKLDSKAADAKLEGYSDAQKTNTAEVKENGASLATPLKATASIGWKDVTSGQYKIEKLAFLDQGSEQYDGIYLDENKERYFIDFRVVVYLKDEVDSFTVTDVADYGLTFRAPDDKPVTLEGMCDHLGYWDGYPTAHQLTALNDVIVTNTINGNATECAIIVTAPEGQKLKPGAYHLRVPADVTGAVARTVNNTYAQSYQNTATLTSVDGVPTSESATFKQSIHIYEYISKVGGYEIDSNTGKFLLTEDGRPIIRWDVCFGWEFYNSAIVEDFMDNQELYVNSTYPMEVHHMKYVGGKGVEFVKTYASLTSTADTEYMTFMRDKDGGAIGYVLNTAKLIPAEANAEVYKLVYWTVPKFTGDPENPYYTTDLNNHFDVTFTPPYNHNDGFGITPIVVKPTVAEKVSMKLQKEMLHDENDTHNRWRIRANNTSHSVPIGNLTQLIISDRLGVSDNYSEFGSDVTIDYEKPITVRMEYFKDNDTHKKNIVTLVEGVHYTIEKQNDTNKPSWWDPAWGDWYLGYLNLGPESQYGFGVNIDLEAVEQLLAADNCTYFRYIDVEFSSENPVLNGNSGYDILNRGYMDYEYLSIPQRLQSNCTYNRKFSTKSKRAPLYGDYYDPTNSTNVTNHSDGTTTGYGAWTVGMYDDNPANGDGKDEILWKIFVGAREFENAKVPITVTITDTLSDNMTFPVYDGIELKDLFLIEATKARGHVLSADSVVVDGQTFTLTFTVPAGAWAGGAQYSSSDIEITYHTILKPEAIGDALNGADADDETVTIDYSNTASVSWNGDIYTLPTSSGSHAFSTTMLDKASTIVTAVSEIEYNIEINEHALPLNGGNPLVLEDELGAGKENFLYRDDSIILKNLDTNKVLSKSGEVTDSTYTISWAQGDSKGFTISVPDGQRLLLTYRVKPMVPVGENTAQLANSASLNGKTFTHQQNSFKVNASNQEATYTPPAGTAAVSILKLEGGTSIRILLDGAVFTAYPVNDDGTLGQAYATKTSDANGKVLFEFVRNGDAGYETVYCIKETEAPEGYLADDGEWYFYFTVDGAYANANVQQLVESLRNAGKTVYGVENEKVHQMNVENTPVTCDFRIIKESDQGTSLDGAAFGLVGPDGSVVAGPDITTSDGTTYYTFEDLKSGNYVLTEIEPPAGFVQGPVSSWPITIDAVDGTVTINWPAGVDESAMSYVSTTQYNNGINLYPCMTVRNDPISDVELEIPVTKILSGVESTTTAFTFALEAATENAPMPETATVSTQGATYENGQAEVAFAPISYGYEHAGQSFVYRITENAVDAATGFQTNTEAYLVTVDVALENYALSASIASITKDGEAAQAVAFTNTVVPNTSITVTKKWIDENNQDGKRPGSVVINLLANGSPALDEDGNAISQIVTGTGEEWSYTFTDLPKYSGDDEIVYTISEEPVTGYTAEYDQDTWTVINTHTPELTTASVKKVWDDANDQDDQRPDSLTVTLSNGTEVVLNDENGWEATVIDLPKYEGGNEITYTWTEGAMPEGYTLTDNTTEGTVTTLTNSYTPDTTEASVKKVWDDANDQDGQRPDSLTVTLSNGTEVVLNDENGWEATVIDLPKYEGGNLITYTWTEGEMPEGYSLTDTSVDGTITTLTNSYTPELTSATVKKVWDDAEDQDGKRPDSLTVTLSNGTEVTLNEANGWEATVSNLPKYAGGNLITYTWTEGEMPEGYSLTDTSVSGTITTLTNSYTPELTSASVKKVWDDAEDQDGKRPDSLTVTLSNGTEVTLNEANGWEATVSNLPKYAGGNVITYTWTEGEMPEGYSLTDTSVSGTITTLTNSYTPELTSASVKKVWDDAEDQDGKRPDSLTVTLSNGTEVTLNEANSWQATVSNLPKYAGGNLITYTWTEGEMPEGYSLTDNSVSGTITTLTNSYTPELTSATVKKVWDDAEDQDGKRPDSLTVTLSNGTEVTLNEANSWEATVSNLPKYAGGNLITYTWTEGEMPEGYSLTDASVSGTITTLTNSYTPELTSATVKKVWDDAEDQDGKRPDSLTVTLSNGTEVTLNEANGWKATVSNLPKYAGGNLITYSWTEGEMPEGYSLTDTSVSGTITTLTNSYTPELTTATVKKVWDDANDQDGKRPETLTVTLSNGTEVTLNEANRWEATVNNLPKYAGGNVITYTWTEGEMPEGYTLTDTSVNGTITTLTNSYTPELTSATVKKVWDDAEDQDGKRPDSLTVTLSNGTEVTLNEANSWEATVNDLPKYAGGNLITYTWTEGEMPEGYALSDISTSGTVTTLTNSYDPELISATVKKVWDDANDQDGKRPETLTVTLSNGAVVTLSDANGWQETVTNLPKYEGGNVITYTWTEGEMPEGYSLTDTSVSGTITTLTNSYTPELTSATVKKVWDDAEDQDGKRPDSLTVTLSNGTEVTLNEANSWQATVSNLPKYEGGNVITYTWTEGEMPEGYSLTDTSVNGTITTLTNSYTPELTSATVKKVWDDAEDQDGKRPDILTVTLSNGTEVTLNEANGWEATVNNLPKYAGGKLITYTWTEGEMPEGYSLTDTSVNGTITTLTNSYTPELTSATVKKVWDDAEDQDGKRPDSLTVTLSNGTEVTLNEANSWQATVNDLPKYANGNVIVYTWTESDMPEGYALSDISTSGTVTTLTNSYDPELTSATVKKVWEDANDQDGKRPETLTVTLSNGAVVTLSDANGWQATVTGLPKYEDGNLITYTWTEGDMPEGYTLTDTSIDGTVTTLTNSYAPETISLAGTKTWNDASDQDGVRPASIIVRLLANGAPALDASGKPIVQTVTGEGDEWSYTFTELPKYADGEEIVYTVTETMDDDAAAQYTATVDGLNITNTHTVETVTISGTKTWDDLNDISGKRPESITIRLYADGQEVDQRQVSADDDWSWSFAGLPKYLAGKVQQQVVYTITEDPVEGYVTKLNGYDVTNHLLAVAVQKIDEQTGKPLSGATFALYEGRLTSPAGTALETWVSDGTPKVLAGLTAGQTYTVFETKTPAGYMTMTPFVFTVQPTDTPDQLRTFTLSNRHYYRFRKLSSTTNELVYGAHMAIMQGDTILVSWYTSEENDGWYYVTDHRFTAGVTYAYVELEAPYGYKQEAPTYFTLDPVDGTIIIKGQDYNMVEMVMYDQPLPQATPTPEPATTTFRVTKQWQDEENVLGLRPGSITVHLFRKTSNDASYPETPYLTVSIANNGTDVWQFTFSDLPRRDPDGLLYTYMAQEEPVEGYTTTYLNNGRTIVNSIPVEDLPPTPTPTLPYVTPTPSPMPRTPQGVQFIDGRWVYVDEYGVPLGIVPMTGDDTNFALWGAAILLPLVLSALAAVEIRRRKRLMAAKASRR